MREQKTGGHKSPGAAPAPWRLPVAVDDIAESGQHFDLAAGDAERAAVARIAGLRELPRLEAHFHVTRRGAGGLHVAGTVSATVGQNCVVTLEPLTRKIEETVDLVFVPRQPPAPSEKETEAEPRDVKWNDPEPLIDGVVDLARWRPNSCCWGLTPIPANPARSLSRRRILRPTPAHSLRWPS